MEFLNALKRKLLGRDCSQSAKLITLSNAVDRALAANDLDLAKACCAELRSYLESLLPEQSIPVVQRLLGAGYFDLGSGLRQLGMKSEAEESYARSESFLARLSNHRKHRPFALSQLAACKNHFGLLYMELGPREKAVPALDEAIRMRREIAKRLPDDGENRVHLGGALCNRGHVAREMGDSQAAERFYRESMTAISEGIPSCDCGCRESMAMVASKAAGHPHWILLAHRFMANAAQGLIKLGVDITVSGQSVTRDPELDKMLAAAISMASTPPEEGEEGMVKRLIADGHSRLKAELIVTFLPFAFGRALMARLPGKQPRMPDSAEIMDPSSGRQYTVRLADVPEFRIAAKLAEEIYITGSLTEEQFLRCSGSSELGSISQALNAGSSLGDLVLSPSVMLRLANIPGFDAWYQGLKTGSARGDQR